MKFEKDLAKQFGLSGAAEFGAPPVNQIVKTAVRRRRKRTGSISVVAAAMLTVVGFGISQPISDQRNAASDIAMDGGFEVVESDGYGHPFAEYSVVDDRLYSIAKVGGEVVVHASKDGLQWEEVRNVPAGDAIGKYVYDYSDETLHRMSLSQEEPRKEEKRAVVERFDAEGNEWINAVEIIEPDLLRQAEFSIHRNANSLIATLVLTDIDPNQSLRVSTVSVDNGRTWSDPNDMPGEIFSVESSRYLMGAFDGSIFESSDGLAWQPTENTDQRWGQRVVRTPLTLDPYFWSRSTEPVVLSLDSGQTWQEVNAETVLKEAGIGGQDPQNLYHQVVVGPAGYSMVLSILEKPLDSEGFDIFDFRPQFVAVSADGQTWEVAPVPDGPTYDVSLSNLSTSRSFVFLFTEDPETDFLGSGESSAVVFKRTN